MARTLIDGNNIISFNPTNGIIVVNGYIQLSRLLFVNNATRNIALFNFSDPNNTATVTYNSNQNTTTIDVSFNTTSMSSSDKIQVFSEDRELEMKPARTYRDPVSKFRVSTPTTLIDTDFEYGPQPTKWEEIKLINNIPTSYSSPFTENSISIQSILVSSDSDIMVVNTTTQHNLPVGGVVEINSLSDSQYEGTFIVKTSSAINFSVKLPFKSSKSAELSTIYSNAYKGAFYTGSRVQITSATTNTGTASTLTIETPNIHGLNNETKLYLKNSRATRRFLFNVPSAVVGIGTTYYKSEITGIGGSPEPEYYAKNKIITEEIIGKSEINILDTAINTSTGDITYNNSNQNGQIVNSGISTNDVVVFYTPPGNAPITRFGTPSSTNVLNFTPFRVLTARSQSGITTFTINDRFDSIATFIPTSDGSIQYGNHRFIKAYRIIQFAPTGTTLFTIKFNKPVDFVAGERIIINTNFTTASYDSVTNAYLNRYNGEYITSSYPSYIYTVSTVSGDTITVENNLKSSTGTTVLSSISFFSRNVESLQPAFIWCASSVIDHPLSNSLYLSPSSGFSTSKYENYQYVLYTNPDNQRRLPALSHNTNYILQQIVNRPDWYRIYNAENTNDIAANWNTPINLYYNLTGNGSVEEVLNIGIHTITSALLIKNTNTISLPQRGGLSNNADVIYNSSVNPIGNLTPNESYKIKTEDVSLDSNRFRVSNSTGVATLYGINYTVNSNFIDFYVYDLVDRTTYDSSASDGIKSAGIIVGNIIQVSGSNYSNPIKKNFINNSFKVIGPINPYTVVTKLDPNSPAGTSRYIYSVRAEIPTDGTFNTKTGISINVTSAPTALNNVKITSIIPLNINVSGVNGEHILSQDLDGAADDIYEVRNTSSKGFIFNTSSQIPQIIKNIGSYVTTTNAIDFNNVSSYAVITGNNTNSVTYFSPGVYYTGWISATGSIGYTAPVSITFKLSGSGVNYYTAAGLIESSVAGTRTNINYSEGYVIYRVSPPYGNLTSPYTAGVGGDNGSATVNTNDVFKILYNVDGNIVYYRNGVVINTKNIGAGKTLKPFVSSYDANGWTAEVTNISIGDRGISFTPNVTNYLKLSSHNYADGTEVTYNVTPSNQQAILPLINNQNYYVRVLDGDFVGLTTTVESSLDRVQPLIGFSTSGSTSANHTLTTNSIQGYLNGQGSVGVTTSSTTVTGTNTNFLADYTTGDTFRIYQLDNSTSQPGTYFESKIASIKGDKTLKLEEIPSFETSAASYFKETGLYAISDGKIAHRPFDGGVAMFSGLIPNSRVIRQTRKYFRYQSGKGIQVSMAVNFNPTYDIDSISPSKVGAGTTSYFNIRTKFAHKISPNSPNSSQTIIISNVSGSISQLFNSTNDHNGFPVVSVVDDFNFVINIGSQTSSNDIQGFPQYNIKNWQDASIKCGLYDDQNGFFFEYDGVTLYVVRRSSTQQLSGRFQVERNTHLIFGTNAKLTSQVLVNNYIVIRGQTYKVISILNDNSLSIQPAYRGNSSSDVVISKVIDTKVPQSQWNIDRMDGTGESGYDLDISKIQMVYLDYSWYGAGSGRFGFKDQYGEVTYAHEFIHNNIFTESYFRSGNLPARYEVETFDNPLYSPSLFHWGVSVIMDGGFDDDKAYLFTADSNTLPFTNNGYSSTFSGRVNLGSDIMNDITAAEYSQLVVGQELYQANYTHIQKGTTILSLTTDPASNIAGSNQRYLIKMSKPAIAGTTLPSLGTNISVNAFSGTSADIQANIPLVSIRLAPSVDNGNVGNLGFRDIINRMQLTLKSAGILTTHDCEVKLILNGQLSNEEFERVTSPSLSQIYKHKIGERVSEGITVFSFRAQGGSALVESTVVGSIGRRSLSSAEVSLEELALLGNSIIGGDGTFPDGPDILTLVVKAIDPSTISGGSPMIVTGRITWTEAQA